MKTYLTRIEREKLREDYLPDVIEGLFIAESPPEHAFFYYPSPDKKRALFCQLMSVIYKDDFRLRWQKTSPGEGIVALKKEFLCRFACEDGLYLTDASKESLHGRTREKTKLLKETRTTDLLLAELNRLIPNERRREVGIFVISKPAFDACKERIRLTKFNLINEKVMIPFPNPKYPDLVKRFHENLGPLWDAYWGESP